MRNVIDPKERGGCVKARNISHSMSPHWLLLAAILPLALFVPGCRSVDGDESCPASLEKHRGKCLTTMAIVYLDCTEDRGISTTTKVSGGISGSLKIVTGASVNAATEKTKQDDRAVALQVIKDCLEFAKQSRPTNDPEQRIATGLIQKVGPWKKLPRNYIVPDVRGLTEDEARQVLHPLPLKVMRVDETSDDVKEGQVIRTKPAAEEQAKEGATVKLFISTGPEPVPACVVPSIVGLQVDDATQMLEDAGCTYQINESEAPDVEPGTVLDQDPSAGATAAPDSIVTITVAVEPSPSPSKT